MIQNEDFQDELGNDHIATSAQTPMRNDAFAISDEEKIELIKKDVLNWKLSDGRWKFWLNFV